MGGMHVNILVAGGTYMNNMTAQAGKKQFTMVGGITVARLLGRYSKHDIYLHTNMSSEQTKLTKSLQKSLHKDYVNTEYVEKVSAQFGILHDARIDAFGNTFESARIHKKNDKFFQDFDAFILTTDMNQRDFRYFRAYAHNNGIRVIIITFGEYRISSDPLDDVITLENDADDKLPLYHHELKAIHKALLDIKIKGAPLITMQVLDKAPVKRTTVRRQSKLLGQMVLFAGILALTIFIIMSIFQFFSGDAPSERADIDWNAPVRHAECGTVEECTALGDEYLAELEEHIDISQEPYIFFENRPRRTYQDYDVDDGLTLTEEHRELPDSADPYLSYYDEFDALFPDRYTDTIDTYRLFSDGEGNTLAYVDITDEEIIFAMDFRDSGNKAARYRTLIHEFAHIYSLPPEDFDSDCTPQTSMDCMLDDTLMADYTERFWSRYGDEWVENRYKSQYERDAFYSHNINDFYVPYQAMNPKEDYAVTFTMFVTREIPAEDSTGLNNVKVRSMYETPENVAMRVDILKNLLELERSSS